MKKLQTFQVLPDIPDSLSFLEILSRNIWWCWNHDAVDLFRRIDARLWEWCGRNPIRLLTFVPQKRLEELSEDKSFISHMDRVRDQYELLACQEAKDYDKMFQRDGTIAYFSMEFGIHESIPLFAGGLGILAGDHLKAAADLEKPLVAVGLLYREGYFRQFLDHDGWQQEEYPETDIYQLPVRKSRNMKGEKYRVTVTGPEGDIYANVWRLNVGCIPLFLLDTNVAENSPEMRRITSRLYVGDARMRLYQELLLGVGGVRTLTAMGIHPAVCHMNEGHSAFSNIERLHQIMTRYKVDLKTAKEIVPRTTVFTTHTPVPAGNEEFPVDLIKPFLAPLAAQLGIPVEEVISWGQPPGASPDTPLSMFILGSHMAQYCNGVSQLHGKVARRMWTHIWPQRSEDEVPITHVTNGVHIPSFISNENAQLFDRYIGPEWSRKPSSPENYPRIDEIFDEELWRGHVMARARLIRTCRRYMVKQYQRRNAPKDILKDAELVLDQDILTIAFARRFATYKRASLLLHDPERFEAIITNKKYPVQFIFAGKAHPRDNEGKELIKKLIHFARKANIRNRIVFLEDYDIHIARHLVQGADVWLNNPRRPFEACGTSGMKAAVNGVINVSILDGWWVEGYNEDRGWKIGNGEEYTDPEYQDSVESQALYNVLENEVVPCFYDRRNGDIPKQWVGMMKESMKMAMGTFCSHRMVEEYNERFYQPAIRRHKELVADGAAEAKHLAERRERLARLWGEIRIDQPERQAEDPFRVGQEVRVTAMVDLGELRPDDVQVELYYGVMKSMDELSSSHSEPMKMLEAHGGGRYLYACDVKCTFSGRYGFTARITPSGDDWIRFTPGFITWA